MQLKNLKLILFLSCLICFSACNIRENYNAQLTEKHTVKEIHHDINFTYNQLKKGHAGVYWYIEKQSLDYKFDSLKKAIQSPISSLELYRKLAPIVAAIKCGHTRLSMPTKRYSTEERRERLKQINPLQQFGFKVIDQKLYVADFKHTLQLIKKGDEILAIEGIPTTQILEELKSVYASDGFNLSFKDAVLNRSFANIYTNVYGTPTKLRYTLKRGDSVHYIALNTILKKDSKKDSVLKVNSKKDSVLKSEIKLKRQQRYKGYDEKKQPLIDFKFIDSSRSTAYMKVKSFSFPYANFNKFFKESFTELDKAKSENLILDLRENGGGSLTASKTLFSYLINEEYKFIQESRVPRLYNPYFHQKGVFNWLKAILYFYSRKKATEQESIHSYLLNFDGMNWQVPKENNFKGNLYVLINGYSFSATSIIAANIKDKRDAVFVGEETGGAFNGCVAGHIPTLILPHSGLKLNMGLYAIKPAVEESYFGRGIFPDVRINPNFSDFTHKIDPEMNWILNDIRLKTKH